MKTTKMLTILVLASAIMVWTAEVSEAAEMGTAFTYQGHLYDNNDVADGEYDFRFSLYDVNVGSAAVANDVNVHDIDVIDGYFTVELDFGEVFNGDARWLEIGVRPGVENDPCTYEVLLPRQELTPTPYAIYAKTAGGDGDWMVSGNDMYSIPTGNVGIGTTSPSEVLDVNGNININSVYKIGGATILSNAGTDNIFTGEGAGASNTTGYDNSAMGYEALWSNTTGRWNSAVGKRALWSNITGYSNSAMGSSALHFNTEGVYNSAMGASALRLNTTGYENSAMGVGALRSNTTGNYNSAVGREAGRNNSTGSGNVFLGYKAGYNETGSSKLYIANSEVNPPLIYGEFDTGNVGIGTTSPAEKLDVAGTGQMTGFKLPTGASSGYVLTSDGSGVGTWQAAAGGGDSDWMVSGNDMYSIPSGNVGIGTTSPSEVLDVNGNININSVYKIGGATILSNAGSFNIFVGEDAGASNTTGYRNSAMGEQALYSNTTGNKNSAVGNYALWSNTTGWQNSAVGGYALRYNTTGGWNSAMGFEALRYNTTGNGNSAVGTSALWSNSTGYYNSAVGINALADNSTGYYNSAVGSHALYLNTTGYGNSAMGFSAGSNNSTGSGNVFLGNEAGYNETGSNKLYIANDAADANVLIYGDFSTGNVGIGTTSPTAKLHVGGTAGVDGIKFPDGTLQTTAAAGGGDSDWMVSGNDMYSIPSGNVGIGTTSPSEVLDVNGNININSVYKIGGATILSNAGPNNIFVGEGAGASITTGNMNSAVGNYALYDTNEGSYNTAMGYQALFANTTGTQNSAVGNFALYSNTTGRWNSAMGMYALFLNTTGNENSAMGYQANYYNEEGSRNTMIGYEAGRGTAVHNKSGNVFIGYQAGYNETGDNKLYIANSSTNPPLIYGDFSTGRVGLGTTSPNGTLDVNGPIYQRGGELHADYVFEPGYQLESIDEHSEFMWANKHLAAIPEAKVDENGQQIVEVGAHRKGIVEELEKAHIYIEQLHKRIKELKEQNEATEARFAAIEAVVGKLSVWQEGGRQ